MALIGHPSTKAVRVDREDRLVVETQDVRGFYIALPQLARKANVRLFDVQRGRRIAGLGLLLPGGGLNGHARSGE